MEKIESHHGLEVWKKAIELVKKVYLFTKKLPSDEKFVLVSQMRRAAISVPSNIAEGAGKKILRGIQQFSEYCSWICYGTGNTIHYLQGIGIS